jgi:hypothetical protein
MTMQLPYKLELILRSIERWRPSSVLANFQSLAVRSSGQLWPQSPRAPACLVPSRLRALVRYSASGWRFHRHWRGSSWGLSRSSLHARSPSIRMACPRAPTPGGCTRSSGSNRVVSHGSSRRRRRVGRVYFRRSKMRSAKPGPLSVSGRIRVGLTGLPADGPAATAAMFAPCPNIALAAGQIGQFERCKTLWRFKADPIYCAIAAYHGSWERPDAVFADAVKATVVKGDAQNFDMSEDAYFDTSDAAGDALKPDPHAAPIALGAPLDDRDRAWSSALFPLKLPQTEPSSTDVPNRGLSAIEMRSHGREAAVPTTTVPPGLFVPISTRWWPW